MKVTFKTHYFTPDFYVPAIIGDDCHVYCPPGRSPLRFSPGEDYDYEDGQYDLTKAQKALLEAEEIAFEQLSIYADEDLSPHGEHTAQCGPWLIYHTDTARLGLERVDSDRTYLVRDDRYLFCEDVEISDGVAKVPEVTQLLTAPFQRGTRTSRRRLQERMPPLSNARTTRMFRQLSTWCMARRGMETLGKSGGPSEGAERR